MAESLPNWNGVRGSEKALVYGPHSESGGRDMRVEFSALSATNAITPVFAPRWPIGAAGLSSALAILAVMPGRHNITIAVTGYLLGALATPAFTIVYRFGRRKAAQNPFFIPKPALERVVLAILALAMAAGVANAWFVATELAKQ